MLAFTRRSDFNRYLRHATQSSSKIELKFNPNHDPATGRFTFRAGGNLGVVKPPFPPHPGERPIYREVSAKLNRLVTDPRATESLTVAGATMTFSRTGPDTISMQAEVIGGAMTMDGRYTVGTNQMNIALGAPQLTGIMQGVQVSSFPSSIIIIRSRDGRMIYSLDRPLDAGMSFLGKTRGVHSTSGAHYFGH